MPPQSNQHGSSQHHSKSIEFFNKIAEKQTFAAGANTIILERKADVEFLQWQGGWHLVARGLNGTSCRPFKKRLCFHLTSVRRQASQREFAGKKSA